MNARLETHSDEETVREILRLALTDASEILVIIALLETQNSDDINHRVSEAGAAQAGIVIRNSLIGRLVTLVTRAYAESRPGDLHLQRAFDLLKDNPSIRLRLEANGSSVTLSAAEKHWQECRGNHRREQISHFRDKLTVHLGQPRSIPMPVYSDLFGFANATIDGIEKLAFAIGLANVKIRDNIDAWPAAHAFWQPWKAGRQGT